MRHISAGDQSRRFVACTFAFVLVAVISGLAYSPSSAIGPGKRHDEVGRSSSVDALPDLGIGASLHGQRPFPYNNPWNQDVSRAPVDSNSTNLINSMGANVTLHPDFGTVYNGAPNGIPYMVVAGTQPLVPMMFTDFANQSDPGPYPIPPNAPIEGGPTSTGDRHVLVIDRDNWKLYELFSATPVNSGASWTAKSGAIFNLNSNAVRPAGWTSADAAGLPIFPGLVRYDEVYEQGAINHAVRFTADNTRRAYVYPARHFASSITDPNVPPMGTRVRLKASFDITGFSPAMRVILTGLKKYGMMLADNGSNWYVNGAPDSRWDDDDLHTIDMLQGSDFEVVRPLNHLAMPMSDFDGDGRTDISIFRPSGADWFIQSSTNGSLRGQRFGVSTDVPTPGDFDGDGLTDIAVFRNGSWYILQSSNSALRVELFGTTGDSPVTGDFDGDGKMDVAVFRSGQWYIRQSSDNVMRAIAFGISTDRPFVADYDGDGLADVAVWRPSTGTWYVRQSSNNSLRAQVFGMNGDVPVASDYDADGKADVAVFRPANGTWYVIQSFTQTLRAQAFGISSDRPAPGDYDGDWSTDFAVFRQSEGNWYILSSYTGTLIVQHFGTPGDVPVPSAYLP